MHKIVYNKKSVLGELVRLHISSQHRIFTFSCTDKKHSKKLVLCMSRSDDFQLIQLWFVTYRKKLEEDFADEEFLHKKINSK